MRNLLREVVANTPKKSSGLFFCVSHFFEGGGKCQEGVSQNFGGVLTSLKKYCAIWDIAAIVSRDMGPLRPHADSQKGAQFGNPETIREKRPKKDRASPRTEPLARCPSAVVAEMITELIRFEPGICICNGN